MSGTPSVDATDGVPVRRTERLLLRGFTDADRDPFFALNSDPVVMEHFVEVHDRARSDAFVDRILRRWAERGWGLWALERLDTGEFIGYTGLWPAEFEAPFTPAVEVGWRLAHAHWGHGFATSRGSITTARILYLHFIGWCNRAPHIVCRIHAFVAKSFAYALESQPISGATASPPPPHVGTFNG